MIVDNQNLKDELEVRLTKVRSEGLVDVKAEIDVNNHSNTRDILTVLNNVLRIRETRPSAKYSF